MTNASRLPLAATALALVLCAGMTPASAQTITSKPQQSTILERTIVRERVAPAPKVKTQRKATSRTTTRAASRPTIRTTTHERIVTSPAPVRERVVAPATRTIVTGGPLDLSPAERTTVYRTIVERPVRRDIVTPAPVVTERIVAAPVDRRPLVMAEAEFDDDDVVAPARGRIVAAPETTGVAIPSERVELVVGTRVPRNIPLYDLPARAVAAAPIIGQYRYAQIEDRVYLVDPADGVVVAELYH
jgi:hypothetical protein